MARPLRRVCYGLLIMSLFWILPVVAQYGAKNGEWPVYGGDAGSTRYSPLDQITKDNVKNLQVAWSWKGDNFGSAKEYQNETTPIMVKGVLYFTAGNRRAVVAIDAGTGETRWVWRPDEGARFDQAPRKISRGVAYWTDGREDRIVTVTPGFQLVALDAKTGIPVKGFGQDGAVDLFKQLDIDNGIDPLGKIGNSSPPVISKDIIVVGPALIVGTRVNKENVKADVMGFDVRTGKKVWTFHTIPRKGEPGYETWLNGSADYTGNAGVWAPFSVDEETGRVYLPVEAPTNDIYGGHRPGANLYSDSLVCADIKTGKVIWYQQLIHHDIWDRDIPSHPILLDITANGQRIKAVVQLTKQSYAYVFDRATGKPVWPIDEKPVPQTDVAGEWTSPTQPIPSRPPAYDVQGITRDDLINFTPQLREQAVQALEGFRFGSLYTPPSLAAASDGTKGLLMVPGYTGGVNWESGAADPETGFVYIGSKTDPSVVALAKPGAGPGQVDSDYQAGGGGVPRVQGLPLLKPPYGRITAIDMNKGEIAWMIANGDTPPAIRDNPALKGLTIPRTGSPSRAGLLVTKTLLFAGEGWGGQPYFRAMDKATGAILWEFKIPAGTEGGLPMTYMYQGRQFIVLTAGDATAQSPAQLVSFAIPAAPAAGQRGGAGQRGAPPAAPAVQP